MKQNRKSFFKSLAALFIAPKVLAEMDKQTKIENKKLETFYKPNSNTVGKIPNLSGSYALIPMSGYICWNKNNE